MPPLIVNASARYPVDWWNTQRESTYPPAIPTAEAATPRHSAWKLVSCTIALRGVPDSRRSAIAWRRSGTVSRIALNANRNPSSAPITANSALACPLGRKRLVEQRDVLVRCR